HAALSQLSMQTLAQLRGLLFQEFAAPFPQTVWDYCSMGRYPHLSFLKQIQPHDKDIVLKALEQMDLLPFIQCSITHLSGGEKRRLAIATLLAQAPHIYLLDEPTNHLDMRHQVQVLTHFHTLAKTQNALIVMSLHDVNWIQRYCDHLLLLFGDGEILHGPTA